MLLHILDPLLKKFFTKNNMTYSSIFDEAELPQELKRHKREINKLRKVIDSLETEITIKEFEIQTLKDKLKKK